MEQQVLTNEQMKELESLGIDTSNASMCFCLLSSDEYIFEHCIVPNSDEFCVSLYRNDIIPTFTLQDILGMLPMSIKLKDKEYAKLVFDKWGRLEYVLTEYGEVTGALHYVDHTITTLLDSAFEMLKWCKQNEYI